MMPGMVMGVMSVRAALRMAALRMLIAPRLVILGRTRRVRIT